MSAIIVRVVSIFLLSFLPCVLCQIVITTVPDTSNGDAYVAAVLGEANVTLECVLLDQWTSDSILVGSFKDSHSTVE